MLNARANKSSNPPFQRLRSAHKNVPVERLLTRIWVALAGVTIGLLYYRFHIGHWLINAHGRPIAHDFVSFWAGGVQAWNGTAELVYDPVVHTQVQSELFGAPVPYNPLPYPPHFLFFMLPFAVLAYFPALLAFLLSMIAGYAAALRTIVGDWFTAIAMTISFGGAYLGLYYLQAPFLFGALLVGGLALMPTRPIVAGVLFGMLTVKPHLGVALAVALFVGREWKTIAAAIGTAVLLFLAATVAFGRDVWPAYYAADAGQLAWLVAGNAWVRGSSVYEALFPFVGWTAAMAIHAISAALALLGTVWLWNRRSTYRQRAAAVIAATLLVSPYLYPYDAVILTGAAAFLLVDEPTSPEKLLIVLACVLPGFAFFIYAAAVPIAAWLMLYVAVRHTERQAPSPVYT